MANLKEKFLENVSPENKRRLAFGVAGLAVLALSWTYITSSDTGATRERAPDQPYVKNPLTRGSGEGLGLEAMAGRLANMQKLLETQTNTINNMQTAHETQLSKARQESERKLSALTKKLDSDRLEAQRREKDLEQKIAAAVAAAPVNYGAPGSAPITTSTVTADGIELPDYASGQPVDPIPVINEDWALFSDVADDVLSSQYEGGESDGPPVKIVKFGDVEDIFEDEIDDEETPQVYIPAGSIITGTLISGMDAPTGNGGRSEPFPALLKIDSQVILPNRGRTDLTGCFLLAGGFGDLASERAYLRSEVLSCKLSDGRIIEASIDAYATGEDGKTGVRGRLVNRMGSVLANSLLAGFASAAADIFTPKSVPVIGDTQNSFLNAQQSSDALSAGLGGGAASSLDRLSQYYLDMAENTFPVVEIDAMRRVSFIMVRGSNLAERGSVSPSANAALSRAGGPQNNLAVIPGNDGPQANLQNFTIGNATN